MNSPNLLQQLYLKTALNENTDGMFEHPVNEGYHKKAIRLFKAGRTADANLADDKAEASEMRRGGASRETMKRRFSGRGDYAAGAKSREKFAKDARAKRKAKGITEGLLQKLDEGSRGEQRLKRKIKSVTKNYQQGKAMVGKRDRDVAMRELVSPESTEAKASRAALIAGANHMKKKSRLRGEISSRTRAAAMRERGRAGLNPNLPSGASTIMSRNTTGGYEHQENPKRIPKAVQTYRKASAFKRNMYR